jgi:hypothetical protein
VVALVFPDWVEQKRFEETFNLITMEEIMEVYNQLQMKNIPGHMVSLSNYFKGSRTY